MCCNRSLGTDFISLTDWRSKGKREGSRGREEEGEGREKREERNGFRIRRFGLDSQHMSLCLRLGMNLVL